MKPTEYNSTHHGQDEGINLTRVFQALSEFANAVSWEQTHQILRRHKALLLSDTAIALVKEMIAEHEADDDKGNALNWQQHMHLLEDAREQGITKAWKSFMLQYYKAANAHDALVSATTKQMLYQALQTHQTIICSDTLKFLLYETITQEYAASNMPTVRHLEKLFQLLIDVCTCGIVIAWKRFVDVT